MIDIVDFRRGVQVLARGGSFARCWLGSFILKRLVQTIPVLVLASLVVFLLLRFIPGDPALILAGPDAPADTIAAIRQDLGLDAPLPVQYLSWVGRAIQGDLGHSYISRMDVSKLLWLKLPATLELAIGAFTLALLISVPLGIIAALHSRGKVDLIISSFTAAGLGLPNFWIGILLMLLFAVALRWLPPGGRMEFGRDPVMALKFLLLPALSLAIPQAAIFTRFIKAAVVDVLHEDYVRTAHAKGLNDRAVVQRHVLRNALVPVVTVLSMHFGRLLGGAVVIESVFTWPGIGRLMLDAIGSRDYAVVQGGLLLLVTMFIAINLLTDLSYGFLDPRIRQAQQDR